MMKDAYNLLEKKITEFGYELFLMYEIFNDDTLIFDKVMYHFK